MQENWIRIPSHICLVFHSTSANGPFLLLFILLLLFIIIIAIIIIIIIIIIINNIKNLQLKDSC